MGTRRSPGTLEAAVLRILWDTDGSLAARDVQAAFDEPVPALTTVLTVLERLRSKDRVRKEASPAGGFRFSASQSESGHAAAEMLTALLATSDRSATLLRFAGDLDRRDVDVLRAALADDPR